MQALVTQAFEATVTLGTASGLAAAAWVTMRPLAPPRAAPSRARALLAHPLGQLLFFTLVVLVNQVLFNAYVLRVHGGSPAFVARYLGPGWFALATKTPIVRFVAAHVGDGRWLAPTVLRVQAFLELPWTIYAYLGVARMLGKSVQRTLVRPPLLLLASASFSMSFSLIEIWLRNPWTKDDLVLRAASAIVTPIWVLLVARVEARASLPGGERPPAGVLGLFAFLVGAGAVSYIVLAIYDALLLYNLGHLPRYAGGLAVAIVLASAASWAAPRIDDALAKQLGAPAATPSPSIDAVTSALVTYTIVFFVPSLSLRYWGAHASAISIGFLLVVGSALSGLARAARRAGGTWPALRALASAAVGLAAGGVAAGAAFAVGVDWRAPELTLARVSLSFLAVGIAAMRTTEIVLGGLRPVCSGPYEAKAQADEA